MALDINDNIFFFWKVRFIALSSRVLSFPGENDDKCTKKTSKMMIDLNVNNFGCK